jgi:peptidoglycan/LPS O-acetylase OafA/YrhL
LLHGPIINVFQCHPILRKLFPFHNVFLMEVTGAICATVLSFTVAILSWNFFEKPILSLKDRLAP